MRRKQATAVLVMAIALMNTLCSVACGSPIANRFVAGTPVQTPAGPRAIEKLRKGDKVCARDPSTGKTELKSVLQTIVHKAPAVVVLGFSQSAAGPVAERITCTPQHPFYVKDKGFVSAGELGIGTQIVTRAGPALFLKTVSRRNEPAGVLVYNFEVEGDHTYFVGAAGDGLWVHNDCPGDFTVPPGNTTHPVPMTPEDALDTAADWLGPGYREAIGRDPTVGPSGTFISQDGQRVVRMTARDLDPNRGTSHMNFETWDPSHTCRIGNLRLGLLP